MIVTMLLLCLQEPPSGQSTGLDRQAPSAQTQSKDLSDFLGLLLAADFGGGLDAQHQPSVFGGLKIGVPVGVKGGYPPTVLRTVVPRRAFFWRFSGVYLSRRRSMATHVW